MKKLVILILWFQFIFSQGIQYFDGDRALSYIYKQCEFGPRFPGSKGHEKSVEYFTIFFKGFGDKFILMNETILHPYDAPVSLRLSNFLVLYNMYALAASLN